MAKNLTATLRLIDQMSSTLDKISQGGKDALDQWEKAGVAIDTAFDDATVGTAKAAHSIDGTSDSVDNYSDEIDKARRETERFGDKSIEAGRKSEEFGEKTTDALNSIEDLLVGAGIVAGLKAVGDMFISTAKDAIEFESAITGVYKTVNGTTEQLAAISDEIRDLSTDIPSTTTEISAVAEAAGQLGIATENVMSFTEVMINLGEATNLTADEAASSLAKFSNITQMSAQEYENLGSTIVALGNNLATTEADIVHMATRMASAGKLAGLTEPQILALAGSLSSVGIEADAGGSAMSTLLSRMQLAVETGNESLEQFASVAGYTADEFSQKWGENAVDALYAFISGLNDTERNGASATAILDEMGITEIRLSNAVKSLASNHEGLADALTLADKAWAENNALAEEANKRYATLESKLAMTKNAATNLSIAIGKVFTPSISSAADSGKEMLENLTDFVEKNPTFVKAVASATVGVGTFVAGLTAYVAITKVAEMATAALTAMMATHPLVLYAAAVAGISVALGTLAYTMNEVDAETAELHAELDNMTESLRESREEYENASTALESEYESSISLVAKLEELSSTSEKAAANQALIIPIVEELNERYGDLDLTFDKLSGKFNMTAEEIREIAKAEAELQKAGINYDQYVKDVGEIDSSKALLDQAIADLEQKEIALKAASDAYNSATQYATYGESANLAGLFEGIALTKAGNIYNKQKTYVEELQAEYDLLVNRVETFERAYGYTKDTVDENTDSIINYKTAVSNALTSITPEIEELCMAYDEAFEAARESIDGQIGLFEEMVVETEKSIEEMQGAWQSQINYLTTYTENLKKAMEYGLDEALVEQLSDGSEESAAYLDTIISKVEELGGKTDEAKKFVDGFNAQFQEVEEAKNEFASTVADMETDFSEKLEEIEGRLEKSIDNLDLKDTAAQAAKDTMSAYIEEIINGGNNAAKAAAEAAEKVRAAIAGYGTSDGVIAEAGRGDLFGGDSFGRFGANTIQRAYASGTTNAEAGFALVGEDGPEIVHFKGGETVYTSAETSKILSNSGISKDGGAGDGSKTIRIDINGSGAIEVNKSADEETVLGVLQNHLKPVLLGIIKEEIFEEGDLAYDY